MLCRQIWNFLATEDIPDATRGIKEKLQPYRGKHFGAIIEPERYGELLRAIQGYQGGIIVRSALQLAPLLFQRPYNLRTMQWKHLDLKNMLWTIPSEEMKREKHEKSMDNLTMFLCLNKPYKYFKTSILMQAMANMYFMVKDSMIVPLATIQYVVPYIPLVLAKNKHGMVLEAVAEPYLLNN
jgi:integrase